MNIDIVTIFPEYFAPLELSLLGKARRGGLLDLHVHDLREWTHDRHRTVDDTPYGGGPGMVMKPGPWGKALDSIIPPPGSPAATFQGSALADPASSSAVPHPADSPGERGAVPGPHPPGEPRQGANPPGAASEPGPPDAASGGSAGSASLGTASPGGVAADRASDGSPAGPEAASTPPGQAGTAPRLIIPTPSGRPFTQADAARYAAEPWLVFACGRYEGIDSRVAEEARTRMPVDEVSLGDFVLAGGEVAVLVMVEAIGRLLPGVLGNADSVADDSFAPGAMESLLEGPVYTKPPVWRERPVPDVLLSGHHGAIARWRRDEALRRTARHRPELLARLAPETLDERDRAVLREAGFPVDGEDMAD